MTTERKYKEQDISAIFEHAAEAQKAAQHQLDEGEGLTLAELQEIGKEAGITPEFIAKAAAAMNTVAAAQPPTKFLGFPVTASRTVDLPGLLSEEGWDRLVADLRDTFHATGRISRDGSLRQWRNGNLQIIVEPTEPGHRIRFRTLNQNLRSALVGGGAMFVMGLVLFLMAFFSGQTIIWRELLPIALLVFGGLGSIGYAAYRLPRWSTERERQMEAIAARTVESVSRALPVATNPDIVDAGPELDSVDSLGDEDQVSHEVRRLRTRS